ncbi:hypothetical protein ACHAPU_004168 [Fusarium lateritium]
MTRYRPLAPYPDSSNTPHPPTRIYPNTPGITRRWRVKHGGSPFGVRPIVGMSSDFQRTSYQRDDRLSRTQGPIDLVNPPWPTASTYPLPESSEIRRQVEVATVGARAASRVVVEAVTTPHEPNQDNPDPSEYPASQAHHVPLSSLTGISRIRHPRQYHRQQDRLRTEMESWRRRYGIDMARHDLYELYQTRMANYAELSWEILSSRIRARQWRDFQRNANAQLPVINEDPMDISEEEGQSTIREESSEDDSSTMAECGSTVEEGELLFYGLSIHDASPESDLTR